MQAVPGYSHLYRRGAVYWLRLRVPTDLESYLPFAEWKQTLRTKDLEEAKRLLRARLVEIDHEIATARAKASVRPSPPLTKPEAQRIARGQLVEWLAADEDARLADGLEAHENAANVLEARADEDREALATGDWRAAQRSAEFALEEEGRWYPADDPSLKLLSMELLKARVQLADMITLRQRGEVVEAPAPMVSIAVPAVPSRRPEPLVHSSAGSVESGGGMTLATLVEQYQAARMEERGPRAAESNRRKYSHIFRALEELLGADRQVASISRADCREVISLLRRVPANASKKYPGLSLKAAASAADRDGAARLAPNTLTSYMQGLSAVFNWALAEEVITRNPVKGLVKKGDALVKRRGYRREELELIFKAVAPFREEVPSRFWVPAIALYTGGRLNEPCQMSAVDIGEEGGVHYLDFTKYDPDTGRLIADRSLKTDESARKVPIHADLIAAGFLDFVADVRRRGGGRLFPEREQGPDGLYSHAFTKWWGRSLDRLGLTSPALTFHGFRHGFKDVCGDCGIPEGTAEALGGWAAKSVAARYGDRTRLAHLARESAKIDFDGFSLAAVVASVPPQTDYRVPNLNKTPAAHDHLDGPRNADGGKRKRSRSATTAAMPTTTKEG